MILGSNRYKCLLSVCFFGFFFTICLYNDTTFYFLQGGGLLIYILNIFLTSVSVQDLL